MRRTKTESIAKLVSDILSEYKIDGKLLEKRIINAWSEVLGPLSKPDDVLYINNRVLYAKLSSSVVRNELFMMRSTLLQRLNEKVGEEVITDIVFR